MYDVPNLILCQSDEVSSSVHAQTCVKALAASLLRNLPAAEVMIIRDMAGDVDATCESQGQKLFNFAVSGLIEKRLGPAKEHGIDVRRGILDFVPDPERYPWILFLGSGTLALRGIDHLFPYESTADILWAPMDGIPTTSFRCNGYLSSTELSKDFRPARPYSRPWMEAASSRIWAVRGARFTEAISAWNAIVDSESSTCDVSANRERWIESAWNRMLIDTSLKVARFEKREIQFPALPMADFLSWKNACLVNVGELEPDIQCRFIQAWYFGAYLAFPSGQCLSLWEGFDLCLLNSDQ